MLGGTYTYLIKPTTTYFISLFQTKSMCFNWKWTTWITRLTITMALTLLRTLRWYKIWRRLVRKNHIVWEKLSKGYAGCGKSFDNPEYLYMASHLGHYSTLDLKVFTENGFNNIIFYHKSNFQGRLPCKAPGLFIFNMNHWTTNLRYIF